MARGRFLSRDVSTSLSLADLQSDFSRLLFTWMIPHADRDGRVDGRPRSLRAQVVPLVPNIGDSDIEAALADMVRVGIVDVYIDERGCHVAQIRKFHEHQQGMRYRREGASKFGEPVEGTPREAE